jgi:hypothetical protein
MLPIDSVKLVMMLMNAALSVTEPIAGFQITGEWVWSHFVQVVKINAKPPQDSASAPGLRSPPVPHVPSTSRHDGVSQISSSSKGSKQIFVRYHEICPLQEGIRMIGRECVLIMKCRIL